MALEFLRSLCALGVGSSIRVLVPAGFDAGPCRALGLDCTFERLPFRDRWGYSLGRLVWGLQAGQWLRRSEKKLPHFVPYFQNYGAFRKNTVLVPDLHWRIAPDADRRDRLYKWWSARGAWRPAVHWLEERAVATARRLVVLSEFVKAQSQHWLATPAEKIAVIPLAPPHWVTEAYDPRHEAAVAARFGLPRRFVVYLGRYEPRKNVRLLLEACGELFQRDPTFRCVCVGLDQPETRARFELQAALADSAVGASVISLPSVDRPTLAALLRLAEFSVYPSLSEGFGLPILEAAAAERLCLCADNSSLREVQSEARFRLPTADRAAWVQRIGFHWAHPALTRQAGAESHRLAGRYSWARSAAQLWDFLQS
jgi:glycosyltransferase involved in cell wall biosynthesis